MFAKLAIALLLVAAHASPKRLHPTPSHSVTRMRKRARRRAAARLPMQLTR